MNFSFHPDAASEFRESVLYYENIDPQLGSDFALEVLSAINKIQAFPLVWPIIEGEIHRIMVNRFPFGVLYTIHEEEIFILAVMHLHRHPDYWKKRK